MSGSAGLSCGSGRACCCCPRDWQTRGSTGEERSSLAPLDRLSKAFGGHSTKLNQISPAGLGSPDSGWSVRAVGRPLRSPRDSGSPSDLGGWHGGASGTASVLGGPLPPPQIQLWGESWSQRPTYKNTGEEVNPTGGQAVIGSGIASPPKAMPPTAPQAETTNGSPSH